MIVKSGRFFHDFVHLLKINETFTTPYPYEWLESLY